MAVTPKINWLDTVKVLQGLSQISAGGLAALWKLIGGWKGALALILAACMALGALSWANTRRERDAAVAGRAEANRTIAVLRAENAGAEAAQVVYVEGKGRVRTVYVERKREYEQAVEANAEWANQPIPSDVLSSLSDD